MQTKTFNIGNTNYLTDNQDLVDQLEKACKIKDSIIILRAPTCSGKSYLQMKVLKQPVILVVPFNAIGNDFNHLYNIPFVCGKKKIPLIENKLPQKMVINWDQLSRIDPDTINDGTILVVDEYHQMNASGSTNFRLNVLPNIINTLNFVHSFIIMSGTGTGSSIMESLPGDGDLFRFDVEREEHIRKTTHIYDMEMNCNIEYGSKTNLFKKQLYNCVKDGGDNQLVFVNSKKILESCEKIINERLPEYDTHLIVSPIKPHDLNKFTEPPVGKNVFFCTCVVESGIRLEWRPDSMSVIWNDKMTMESIQQLSERPGRNSKGELQPITNINIIGQFEKPMVGDCEFSFGVEREQAKNKIIKDVGNYEVYCEKYGLEYNESSIKHHRSTSSMMQKKFPLLCTETEFPFLTEWLVYSNYYKWLKVNAISPVEAIPDSRYDHDDDDEIDSNFFKALHNYGYDVRYHATFDEPEDLSYNQVDYTVLREEIVSDNIENGYVRYNKKEVRLVPLFNRSDSLMKYVNRCNYLLKYFNIKLVRELVKMDENIKKIVQIISFHMNRANNDLFRKDYIRWFMDNDFSDVENIHLWYLNRTKIRNIACKNGFNSDSIRKILEEYELLQSTENITGFNSERIISAIEAKNNNLVKSMKKEILFSYEFESSRSMVDGDRSVSYSYKSKNFFSNVIKNNDIVKVMYKKIKEIVVCN